MLEDNLARPGESPNQEFSQGSLPSRHGRIKGAAVAGAVLVGALVFYEAYSAFRDFAVPAIERAVGEGYARLVGYHLR